MRVFNFLKIRSKDTPPCLLANVSLFGRFLHCSDQDSPDPVINYEVFHSCGSSVKALKRKAASAKISGTSTKYVHLGVSVSLCQQIANYVVFNENL